MADKPESPALAALASQPAYVPSNAGPPTAPATDEPDPSDERFRKCQATLGHSFSDMQLLIQSLTHASIARTRLESNERLEFLGDAIMGTVVCEYLFATFPEYPEGELTRIKSAVVSRHTCARLSLALGIGECLLLGKGLAVHERIPDSILAASFESVVAALYLDGGWDVARRFLIKSLSGEVEKIANSAHGQNYKSQLQQYAQKEFSETPLYRLLDEKGPDHSKCFQVAAAIGTKLYPPAWGQSKKEAEQQAAQHALKELDVGGSDVQPQAELQLHVESEPEPVLPPEPVNEQGEAPSQESDAFVETDDVTAQDATSA